MNSEIQPQNAIEADVVLIGGGIMSATLASILSVLEPGWRIVLLEKADELATESSDPWNNAGTGHSGFCELNYMPDPTDGSKAARIAQQFHLTRQWWAHLARLGLLDPESFIRTTAHMNVVFGQRGVDYLRARYRTMIGDPMFAGLEFTEDRATIRQWAPLLMEGREPAGPIAATRHPHGTDVDFGALTRALTSIMTARDGRLLLGHDVRALRRDSRAGWVVSGRQGPGKLPFTVRGRHVFVGAGGYALRLLQRAKLPEVRGYAVLPVGASFYRCSDAPTAARHNTKVYGQAANGAPPMSVPHLDKRIVDGRGHLMFGPYATFSTKLLKNGGLSGFFTTLRWHNLHVIAAAALRNQSLVRYLVRELTARPKSKFAQLQQFFPKADISQWELIPAGQRAQLVTPDRRQVGALVQGTELVTAEDRSMSGLLGASPGASTAVPIMFDLLRKCFPQQWAETWNEALTRAVPGSAPTEWEPDAVQLSTSRTAEALNLRGNAEGALPDGKAPSVG